MRKRKFDSLINIVELEIKSELAKFKKILEDIVGRQILIYRDQHLQLNKYSARLFELHLGSCEISLERLYHSYKCMELCIKRHDYALYYNIYKALYINPNICALDKLLFQTDKDLLLHLAAKDWNTPMVKHLVAIGANPASKVNTNILYHVVVRKISGHGTMLDPECKKRYKTVVSAGQCIVGELVDLLLMKGASAIHITNNFDKLLPECLTSAKLEPYENQSAYYNDSILANHNKTWLINIEEHKRFGNNPLLIAIFNHYKSSAFKILKKQLEQKASFDTITSDGHNILQFFVWQNCSYKFSKALLTGITKEEAQKQVKQTNRSGGTALTNAVEFKRKTKLIALLIKHGADVDHQAKPGLHSNTPAYFAILHHRAENLESLLKHCAKIDSSSYREFVDMIYDRNHKKEFNDLTKVFLKYKIKIPHDLLKQENKNHYDIALIQALQFQLGVYINTYCLGFVHEDVIEKATSFIKSKKVAISKEVLQNYNNIFDSLHEKDAMLCFLCCTKEIQKHLKDKIPKPIKYKILYCFLDEALDAFQYTLNKENSGMLNNL